MSRDIRPGKFCVDCKWSRSKGHYCRIPVQRDELVDLATGKPKHLTAEGRRLHVGGNGCGDEGRLWELRHKWADSVSAIGLMGMLASALLRAVLWSFDLQAASDVMASVSGVCLLVFLGGLWFVPSEAGIEAHRLSKVAAKRSAVPS